jgi:hypothetical protein
MSAPWALERLHVLRQRLMPVAAWAAFGTALAATALGVYGLLTKVQLARPAVALVAASLMLNAFFGATAIAQPAVERYAFTGFPFAWAILTLVTGIMLSGGMTLLRKSSVQRVVMPPFLRRPFRRMSQA